MEKNQNTILENDKKSIWLIVNHLYLRENAKQDLIKIDLPVNITSVQAQKIIKQTLGLPNNICLKLKNHRNSLIALNGKLIATPKSQPYHLEVVEQHQFVKSKPRIQRNPKQVKALRNALLICQNRILAIENLMVNSKEICNKTLTNDIKDLDRQLQFLIKRFEDADQAHWVGMFKKTPLW